MSNTSDLETIHSWSLRHVAGGLTTDELNGILDRTEKHLKASGVGCVVGGALSAALRLYTKAPVGGRLSLGDGCLLGVSAANMIATGFGTRKRPRVAAGE
jgi:hypothetical protein